MFGQEYNKSFILKYDKISADQQEDTLFNFQVYQHLDNILY